MPAALDRLIRRIDPDALDLADLTRELGSALAAARQKFGDGA